MRLLVLGATGVTGSAFTRRALAAGHDVTAFVRTPAKMAPASGLTVLEGDVLDADGLGAAMEGRDALVSMLGLDGPKPHGFATGVARTIVGAAQHTGLRRILVMSAFGVGASLAKGSGLLKLVYRGGRTIFDDKAEGEVLIRAADLDWTIAYPGLLTNGPASGAVLACDLDEVEHVPGLPRISREDVAVFLLGAAESDSWYRQTVVLTAEKRRRP